MAVGQSPFLSQGMGLPSFASSASSGSGPAGPSSAMGGWQQTGIVNFGGSGTGGASSVGGGPSAMPTIPSLQPLMAGAAGVSNSLMQYWPLLLLVGVVWIARHRKSK